MTTTTTVPPPETRNKRCIVDLTDEVDVDSESSLSWHSRTSNPVVDLTDEEQHYQSNRPGPPPAHHVFCGLGHSYNVATDSKCPSCQQLLTDAEAFIQYRRGILQAHFIRASSILLHIQCKAEHKFVKPLDPLKTEWCPYCAPLHVPRQHVPRPKPAVLKRKLENMQPEKVSYSERAQRQARLFQEARSRMMSRGLQQPRTRSVEDPKGIPSFLRTDYDQSEFTPLERKGAISMVLQAKEFEACLCVAPAANRALVRRHYLILAQLVHPDKNPADREAATMAMKAVKEAYDALTR